MDLQLEGKRAVISGSTAGIGYAIAEALAREGTQVVVNDGGNAFAQEVERKARSTRPRKSSMFSQRRVSIRKEIE